MRLKSFQAKTMTEAMRQVKDALGDDAIIVSTREDAGFIRITAAVEQLPEKPAAAGSRFDEEEIIGIISDALLKHRVPGSVSDRIVSQAALVASADPQKTLAAALAKTFRFPETAIVGAKPLMLVGPPGAGKTLMAAKLAAQAVMQGKTPAIITTDIARAGGVEQLSAFLDIMNLPLLTADDAASLKAALLQTGGRAPVIIDTGGLNPFDPQEMKQLARLMTVADCEPALVLPAGFDAEESAEMAMAFDILGVRKMIPTRLDFARRIGGILSAAEKTGLALCEASRTPQVADGLINLTPETLAGLLLPHPPVQEKQARKGTS